VYTRHNLARTHVLPTLSLFILSAAGTDLGLLFPALWFLVPIGLGVFFLCLLSYVDHWRVALLSGWLYGTTATASSLAWFWHMLPFDWLGSYSVIHGAYFAGSIWLLTSLLLGISFAVLSVVLWLMRDHVATPYLIPGLYALSAEVSMWLHTLIALGNESLLEPHFSVPSFGYALTEQHFLLQVAEGGGIASLNVYTAGLAVAVYMVMRTFIARKVSSILCETSIFILIFLSVLLYTIYSDQTDAALPHTSLNVLVFSAATSNSRDKYEDFKPAVLDTLNSLTQVPDIIIFPEGYTLEKMIGTEIQKKEQYARWFGDKEVLLVYTKLTSEQEIYNGLFYESTTHGTIHEHKKRYLAPEGEYATYLGAFIMSYIPDPMLQKFSARTQHISIGPPPTVANFIGIYLAGLSCFEIFSPHLYHDLVRDKGASLLINSSDPTWFHISRLYFDKTLQMARVHAVQNRVPIVVANKGAISYALDADGTLLASTPWNTTAARLVTVSVGTHDTDRE
jgi:apolipoprotein N-acyltransferase